MFHASNEWPDPDYVEENTASAIPTYHQDREKIEEFKKEIESGSLAGVLGVEKNLSEEQEASLARLENKWMTGMKGHFNTATEERKPLMISFDEDDNIVSTEVAAPTIVSNGFDGGEEIRLEYPGHGTEFYCYNVSDPLGWRRSASAGHCSFNYQCHQQQFQFGLCECRGSKNLYSNCEMKI